MSLKLVLKTEAGTFRAEVPTGGSSETKKLILVAHGDKKIAVIKEIRAFTGIGLKEAKEASETEESEFVDADMHGVNGGLGLEAFGKSMEKVGATVKFRREVVPQSALTVDIIVAFARAAGVMSPLEKG